MAYESIIPEKEMVQIGEILDSVGIIVEDLTPNLKMDEIILDSMSLVSFYVELEEKYGFFLPEDVYSMNLSDHTLNSFWADVIRPSLEKRSLSESD